MRIDIIAIHTKIFEGPLSESIIKRAINKGKVELYFHNLRDYTHDNY
jgi:tRNA (guanine37-N1)-methyltransferase